MPPIARQQVESVTRSFEAIIDDVQEGERSVVAKISTDRVDRYRTSFMASGVDLRAYRDNPVVLWEHGNDPARGTMPIGRNQWIKPDGGNRGLIAKTIFRGDEYADMLFRAYQDGGLRGWSIRAINPEHSPPTKDEIRARPELEQCDTVFRRWELGEYSATALPGNQDTLTILASRGIWMPEEARRASVPEAITVNEPISEPITAPFIVERQGTFYVCNRDGSTMATFSDKSTAQECLALMAGGPSLAQQMSGLLGEVAAMRIAAQRDVEEYIALYRYGRV